MSGRIVFGEGDSDRSASQNPTIKWGNEYFDPVELLKRGDVLNVDPSWFAGIRQTDGYSCAYFVLAALTQMQRERGRNDAPIDRLMTSIQEGRTDQLTISEFRERLIGIAEPNSKVFVSRVDLDFIREGQLPGDVALETIKRGYGAGIEIHNQGHLVFAIGHSADCRELICWDALMGNADVRYPDTLLRRVPVDSNQVYLWGGLKLSDKYKFPRLSPAYVPDASVESSNLPRVPQYGEGNRATLLGRLRRFLQSL